MKYKTIEDFVKAVRAGKFNGRVVVDNDCVNAYEKGLEVCNFEGTGPQEALIYVLCSLGVDAELP